MPESLCCYKKYDLNFHAEQKYTQVDLSRKRINPESIPGTQFNLFPRHLKGPAETNQSLEVLHNADQTRRSGVRVTQSLSVCRQVVGFGAQENIEEEDEEEGKKMKGGGGGEDETGHSAYGEVSKLTFLEPSAKMAAAVAIMDIPSFTRDLPLFPYHKILD